MEGFGGDEVIVDSNSFVAEEVVVDADGGESAHLNDAKHSQENYGVDLGGNVGDGGGDSSSTLLDGAEIQFHHREGTDELSVAIDLAKLSQGLYTNNDTAAAYQNGSFNVQPAGINVLSPEAAFNYVQADTSSAAPSRWGDSNERYVFITEDGREATSLEDIDGRTVGVANKFSKPKMSYAQLICEAILNSAAKQLTLSEIYSEIHRRHPYYLLENKNWQNSIRHNLTLNKAFVKVPRSSNEGRGSYWTLEPGAESTIFRRQIGSRGGGSPAVANVAPPKAPKYAVQNQTNQMTFVTTSAAAAGGSQKNFVYVTVPGSN